MLDTQVDHLHAPLATHPDVPLQVHGRCSRIEILAAFGIGTGAKIASWQSGVYEAKHANAELFAFTLDKTSGSFSPTTRYRDYAISRTLIHWESQSITRADSPTDLRYRNHERDGRSIMLFTRLRADDRAFWFLGPARYIRHEGEKPMAITWELAHALRRLVRVVRRGGGVTMEASARQLESEGNLKPEHRLAEGGHRSRRSRPSSPWRSAAR